MRSAVIHGRLERSRYVQLRQGCGNRASPLAQPAHKLADGWPNFCKLVVESTTCSSMLDAPLRVDASLWGDSAMLGRPSLLVRRDCVVDSKLQAEAAVADQVDRGRWRSISARRPVQLGTRPGGAYESAADTECRTNCLLCGGNI